MNYPLLYTFRRCPYAIRARMALAYSGIELNKVEVDLKNKPQDLLNASAKGTVPVLILKEGLVIDESIDIMLWALSIFDPDDWLNVLFKESGDKLISLNDREFKPLLDKYKYSKSSGIGLCVYRDNANNYLNQLDIRLKNNRFLLTDNICLADIALFPFIRQFYMVDPQWFEHSDYNHLQRWLDYFLHSELFLTVMKKV